MDRGTDALKAHVNDAQTMTIRQTRRGWLQECLGCEARTEFKAFVEGTHIADALEDADCCCRLCCSPIHPFTMSFKVREKHGCGRRELWIQNVLTQLNSTGTQHGGRDDHDRPPIPLCLWHLQVLLLPGGHCNIWWTGTREHEGGLFLLRPLLQGHDT
jgi:hypothetical protein